MSTVYRAPLRLISKPTLLRAAPTRYASAASKSSHGIPDGSPETTKEPKPSITRSKPGVLSNSDLAYHWDTVTPSTRQLVAAQKFFLRFRPSLLYSAEKFRTVKITELPEVAFLGRSNVGKSSLLNALMGEDICHTSSKPGRTRSMNFFAVGGEDGHGNSGKLAVLDMPGYGKGSRAEWGPEIMKYLVGRRQLKRAFLLIDAVHGLKESDEELLGLFRENAISHQIILSKVDRILLPGQKKKIPSQGSLQKTSAQLHEVMEGIRAKVQPGTTGRPEALGEIIGCSGERSFKPGEQKLGINHVRWAVLAATGLNDKARRVSRSEALTPLTEQVLEDAPPSDELRTKVPLVNYKAAVSMSNQITTPVYRNRWQSLR